MLEIKESAVARVKNPLPIPTVCRYCNSKVVLKTHKEIYGRDYSNWPYMYGCTRCDSHVGLHPGTDIPLGQLADKALRKRREEVKARFNQLKGNMSTSDAYAVLAKEMKIPVEQCHFGWFDHKELDEAGKALSSLFKKLGYTK